MVNGKIQIFVVSGLGVNGSFVLTVENRSERIQKGINIMKTKHSPKPWHKEPLPNGDIVISNDRETIATVLRSSVEGKAEADGDLIIASPELLEACEKAAELYNSLGIRSSKSTLKVDPNYKSPSYEYCVNVHELLNKAIAKAEGK